MGQAGVDGARLPAVVRFDGRTLVDPTNAKLGEALGVQTGPQQASYDVVVVGAGPSGLAASVYATSEGLRTALLEREAVGGQVRTTSLIRNHQQTVASSPPGRWCSRWGWRIGGWGSRCWRPGPARESPTALRSPRPRR